MYLYIIAVDWRMILKSAKDYCISADMRIRMILNSDYPILQPVGQAQYAAAERSSLRASKSEAGADTAPTADSASISPEARQKLSQSGEQQSTATSELSEEEQAEVDNLKKRDTEVRQHEQAHMSAGGSIVRGGPTFQMKTGPDGKQYAVGGEVSIDTSAVDGNPQATIAKAQQIKRAALAPASPSGQDRAVAAEAAAMEVRARQELAQQSSGGGQASSAKSSSLSIAA